MAEASAAVQVFRAAGEDGGPGGFEEDVGDAGVAVEQDGDAALEGLDGGDAVSLDGGHEEEMGLIVEGLEVVRRGRSRGSGRGRRCRAGRRVRVSGASCGPVPARSSCQSVREREAGWWLQLGEGAEEPVDAFVCFDAADREQAERAAGLDGADAEEAIGVVARPPMRAMWASMRKSWRHSARRNSLVTMVLPPLRRPWAMMRLETAMRRRPWRVRVAASLKSEGVSCMRVWKPRRPASVACSAG